MTDENFQDKQILLTMLSTLSVILPFITIPLFPSSASAEANGSSTQYLGRLQVMLINANLTHFATRPQRGRHRSLGRNSG